MADPLSLPGLVIGLVSLGVQVSGGISKYIGALDCREQDIASVREQNDALEKSLNVVNQLLSRVHPAHQESTALVRQCLEPCRNELKALDALVVDLTGGGQQPPAGWKGRLKSRGKKLLYPYDRPKLEQVESRLRKANMTLLSALQTLNL